MRARVRRAIAELVGKADLSEFVEESISLADVIRIAELADEIGGANGPALSVEFEARVRGRYDRDGYWPWSSLERLRALLVANGGPARQAPRSGLDNQR